MPETSTKSDNEAIVMEILDRPELHAWLKDEYARRVYKCSRSSE
jgi:hypothetical protein